MLNTVEELCTSSSRRLARAGRSYQQVVRQYPVLSRQHTWLLLKIVKFRYVRHVASYFLSGTIVFKTIIYSLRIIKKTVLYLFLLHTTKQSLQSGC